MHADPHRYDGPQTYRAVGARRRWYSRAGGCSSGEQLGLQPGAVPIPEETPPGARPLELPSNLQGEPAVSVLMNHPGERHDT